MHVWKRSILFAFGGGIYMALELLWRGWSHGSMFIAGGTCFLLLGQFRKIQPKCSVLTQALVGAGIITMVEYAAGLLINRNYAVWDYRDQFLNYHGQICLPFCLLWIPISLCAMYLYNTLDKKILPAI